MHHVVHSASAGEAEAKVRGRLRKRLVGQCRRGGEPDFVEVRTSRRTRVADPEDNSTRWFRHRTLAYPAPNFQKVHPLLTFGPGAISCRMKPDAKSGHQSYDPFGEPLATGRAAMPSVRDRRANRVALGVFWTLALLFVAGRVYTTDWPAARAFVAGIIGSSP